jgi:hypothetical protein
MKTPEVTLWLLRSMTELDELSPCDWAIISDPRRDEITVEIAVDGVTREETNKRFTTELAVEIATSRQAAGLDCCMDHSFCEALRLIDPKAN